MVRCLYVNPHLDDLFSVQRIRAFLKRDQSCSPESGASCFYGALCLCFTLFCLYFFLYIFIVEFVFVVSLAYLLLSFMPF